MIISRARRFIFVHVPKTGGTALARALEGRAAAEDILIGDTPKARRRAGRWKGIKTAGRVWKHSTLSDVAGLVTPGEMRDFLVCALVRNPWDRVVSYWAWARAQSFAHPAIGLAKSHDFNGFLNHPQTIASLRLWPYGAYIRGPDGEEAPNKLLIRLENFDDDARPLWQHLGFRVEMGRENASDRGRDWRGYYSDADAALVAEVCAEDIKRFGYRFDPV